MGEHRRVQTCGLVMGGNGGLSYDTRLCFRSKHPGKIGYHIPISIDRSEDAAIAPHKKKDK